MLATHELAGRLAAYIPLTVTRHLLAGELPVPGQPQEIMAAAIFSDISGFTAMSEELASDGPRGAEELNRVLLSTFTGMIGVIHQMGGSIGHFYGDAMSIYFPDEDGRAAIRALACAQKMQRLMLSEYKQVVTNRPPDKNSIFDLTINIGVGYGLCHELIVGNPAGTLEFVLTGTAVEEAAAAEKSADSGEVMASRSVLEKAGLPATEDFSLLEQNVTAPDSSPILELAGFAEDKLAWLAQAALPFVPSALYERMNTASLETLAEHRPATSIFVQFDFVNDQGASTYPAEVGGQLQEYYEWVSEIVARFGGRNARLNRVLTGDKGNQLHIIFGAPVAPDAPDQAIRCALALQQQLPPFITNQRIGLAAGKVFAAPVGADLRHEYTIVGDVVNLSARLAQVCEAGQVFTDSNTAVRVSEHIDFTPLPPVKLKGKQDAIIPYCVKGERIKARRLQDYFGTWDKPLVGRELELDLILGGMDAALRGIGTVATLIGSTGSGKSHLVAAAAKYWLEEGGVGFVGECQPHTADIPFSPWRTIWRDFFNLKPDMDDQAQASAVINLTQALAPDQAGDVGLWREVLGLPIPLAEELSHLTADVRQNRFFELVRASFHALARKRPVLIILEGLHWADQSTLDLLDDLAAHLEGQQIFITLAFRPIVEISLELIQNAASIRVVVTDLPASDIRRLLNHLVGTPKLPPVVEQHLGLRDREGRESAVNPLFLEESLNVMMGMGILRFGGNGRHIGRVEVDENLLSRMQVPDNIHGLLLARLDRLPVDSRNMLQIASVIGREFSLDSLDSITPTTPRIRVMDLLHSLSEAEMTRLLAGKPEWIYLFQHAMTHEVAYESLPFAQRQKLHSNYAHWLAGRYQENLKPYYSELAYHYSKADIHEEGLYYALAAADSAREINANIEAVELYNLAERHWKAMSVKEEWQTAAHLHLYRGKVLNRLGDISKTIVDAEKALAHYQAHNEPSLLAESYNLMAETKYRQGEYEETQRLADIVISGLGRQVPPGELALAHIWYGWAAATTLDYDNALASLRQAEKICLENNDNNRLARVLEAIAFTYYSQKKLEPALEAMQKSVQASRGFSIPINIGISLSNISFVQYTLGQAEDALETVNEAIALGQETGRNLLAHALGNRAAIFTYLGNYTDALTDFEEATQLFEMLSYDHLLVETYLVWGYEFSLMLGDLDDAQLRFETVQKLIEAKPDSYHEEKTRLLIGRGYLELKNGYLEQAESNLETAAQAIEEKGFNWWRPAVHYYLALVRLTRKDTAAAQEYLRKGKEATENGGRPDYLPLLLLEQARLASPGEKQLVLLEKCLLSAAARARYGDKIKCYKTAGEMLLTYDDPHWRGMGEAYLAKLPGR